MLRGSVRNEMEITYQIEVFDVELRYARAWHEPPRLERRRELQGSLHNVRELRQVVIQYTCNPTRQSF